jgi:hypothetical protein
VSVIEVISPPAQLAEVLTGPSQTVSIVSAGQQTVEVLGVGAGALNVGSSPVSVVEVIERGQQGLRGLPGLDGSGAVAPNTRTLTWAAGRLAAVTFADGRSKTITYTGSQLTRVDRLTPAQPTQRADLTYNPDGTLAGVTETVV